MKLPDQGMSTMNNKFLTNSQLKEKVKGVQSEKRELPLQLLNKTLKIINSVELLLYTKDF